MFLEPAPAPGWRRGKPDQPGSTGHRDHQDMAGHFSSTNPNALPRDNVHKRRPLHERSKSQNNVRDPSLPPIKTVRLVPPSPTTSPQVSSEGEGEKENLKLATQGKVARLLPKFDVVADSANLAKPRGYESAKPTIEAPRSEKVHLETTRTSEVRAEPVESEWEAARTLSEVFSDSSTLHVNDSNVSLEPPRERRHRISDGTTLQGSPPSEAFLEQSWGNIVPLSTESQFQPGSDVREAFTQESQQRPTTASQVDSPTQSVVTQLAPSLPSSPLPSASISHHSSFDRPPTARSDPEISFISSPRSLERRSSTGAIDMPSGSSAHRPSAALGFYSSQESLPLSDASYPGSSSPNFVAFTSSPNFVAYNTPSPVRPRSRSHPLNYAPSYESITSRLERSPSFRPGTGRSFATNHSVFTNSSNDTLPPLQVPRKRLRHMPTSISSTSQTRSSFYGQGAASNRSDADPYQRYPFSTNLSTIASESDRGTSLQFSHLSFGSGVPSGSATSIPNSGSWQNLSRESIPEEATIPAIPAPTSNDDEPGDMTLGIFRETSLIPHPLFKELPTIAHPADVHLPSNKSSVDMPDHDEHVDTLGALQAPGLRQKRSGYSIRQRSSSIPNHPMRRPSLASRNESDRWSYGSTIFPTWAKHYYSGAAVLSTKVSMSSIGTTRIHHANHSRHGSEWTEQSNLSRQNTAISRVESTGPARSGRSRPSSPASTFFVPSIFRPRNRPRQLRGALDFPGRSRWHRDSTLSTDIESRADSMEIRPAPIVVDENGNEVMVSDHSRYGMLHQSEKSRRPFGRSLGRRRQWEEYQYPRSITSDHISDYMVPHPHLAPTRRQTRRSAWRPPSFVENFDTLVRSRSNRQILLFVLGFVCPFLWMIGAILPLPDRPVPTGLGMPNLQPGEDLESALMKQAGEAERCWREEQIYLKGRWWRMLNRVMSVVGLLMIGAVVSTKRRHYLLGHLLTTSSLQVALCVVATR